MNPSSPRRGGHNSQSPQSPRRGGSNGLNSGSPGHGGPNTSSPQSPRRGGYNRAGFPSSPSQRQPNPSQTHGLSPRPTASTTSSINSSGRYQSHPTFQRDLELRTAVPQQGARRQNGSVVYEDGNKPSIDTATNALEKDWDSMIQKTAPITESGRGAIMPPRPSFAAGIGRKSLVRTNYMRLNVPSFTIYRYHMDIQPDKRGNQPGHAIVPVPAGKKKQRIIQLLLQTHHELSMMCSDMKSLLYGSHDLFSDCPSPREFRVKYFAEDQSAATENAYSYIVRISPAGDYLTTKDLDDYLKLKVQHCENKAEIIQALNCILARYCHDQPNMMTLRNNSSHFRLDRIDQGANLHRGMLLLRGFFKSVRPATGNLLVNVNPSNTVVYKAVRLSELAKEYMKVKEYMKDNAHHRALENFLKGLRVKVPHLEGGRNGSGTSIRTVCGLAHPNDGEEGPDPPQVEKFGGPNHVIFTQETQGVKRPISVRDYFLAFHKEIKMDEDLPVVCVGDRARRPVYLPMEACEVLPGQPCKETLTPGQKTDMIRFTCRKPKENAESIMNVGVPSLGLDSSNPILQHYRVSVNRALMIAPAFILNPPELQYRSRHASGPGKANNKSNSGVEKAKIDTGSWNMGRIQFHKGATLEHNSWGCVWIRYEDDPKRPAKNPFANCGGDPGKRLVDFTDEMKKCGIRVQDGSGLNQCSIFLKPEFTADVYLHNENTIKTEIHKFSSGCRLSLRFLVVILPNSNAIYYNAVKTIADLSQSAGGLGLLSACVVADKFATKGVQYFANEALKINLKLGGINHISNSSELDLITSGKTMVCGLDVTHPSPGSLQNAPSIAGLVYSIDSNLAQWRSFLWLQTKEKREMATELKDKIVSALKVWANKNKKLPEKVLMYRDGVSEGQYHQVLTKEVEEGIRIAFKSVYDQGQSPKLSVIVVGKRHNTRFYPVDSKDMDRGTANCLPGTVVDRAITDAHLWDFYSLAHKGLQGTARPAHYYVVVDEIFRSQAGGNKPDAANRLIKLTYAMSYFYPRATKAVSIVPPAKLADLLCERGRKYLWKYYDSRFQGTGLCPPTDADIAVHENLQDTMYFI